MVTEQALQEDNYLTVHLQNGRLIDYLINFEGNKWSIGFDWCEAGHDRINCREIYIPKTELPDILLHLFKVNV